MTKQEWKDRHSSTRALFRAAVSMDEHKSTTRRQMALEEVWGVVFKFGMQQVMNGKVSHRIYPLRQNKWAIHHNCSNY